MTLSVESPFELDTVADGEWDAVVLCETSADPEAAIDLDRSGDELGVTLRTAEVDNVTTWLRDTDDVTVADDSTENEPQALNVCACDTVLHADRDGSGESETRGVELPLDDKLEEGETEIDELLLLEERALAETETHPLLLLVERAVADNELFALGERSAVGVLLGKLVRDSDAVAVTSIDADKNADTEREGDEDVRPLRVTLTMPDTDGDALWLRVVVLVGDIADDADTVWEAELDIDRAPVEETEWVGSTLDVPAAKVSVTCTEEEARSETVRELVVRTLLEKSGEAVGILNEGDTDEVADEKAVVLGEVESLGRADTLFE